MNKNKTLNDFFHQAQFVLSAAELSQLSADRGHEIAFIGRSNAGKSSVLNDVTHQKGLARVSKTPGRTQLINVFEIDEDTRLVDLPGYGFAKVAQATKAKWEKLISEYLNQRECLKGLIVIMDIRHPLTDLDQHLLNWADNSGKRVHILLNKCDKLGRGAVKDTLRKVEQQLKSLNIVATCQAFSTLKGDGSDDLKKTIFQWLKPIHP